MNKKTIAEKTAEKIYQYYNGHTSSLKTQERRFTQTKQTTQIIQSAIDEAVEERNSKIREKINKIIQYDIPELKEALLKDISTAIRQGQLK